MKTQALIMILLLLCTAIFASEDSSNAAEYERKTRELNQLAEWFKAETGFVGKISNDTNRMCLGYYEGRFADIQISAEADTASFRLAFEQILDKVLPYTYSHRGQLSRSRITNTFGVIETAYYQQVNGYRVEGAGKLSIAYESGRNGFAIGNGTVDISNELVQINISLDQAIQIGIQRYDPNYNFIPDNELTHPRTKLRYFPIPNEDGIEQYRLCYMVAFWGLAIFIDPSSGNIIDTKTWIIHDYHCTVDGEVYESNYSGYSVNSLGYIPIPDVFIGTDNFSGWTDNNGYVAILDSTLVNLNIKLNYQGLFSLSEYPDTIRVKTPDYINTVQDSIVVRFHDNPCNALNVYYHALNQYHSLDGLSPLSRNLFGMRIIGNMPSSMNYYGEFDPLYNAIRIREDIGQYSHVTRHELSHAFIYDKLNGAFFHNTDQSKRAMDEAFAVYLPCSVINSNLYINSPGRAHDIAHYSVSDVLVNYSQDYPNYVLNEDFYQEYFCRYPIASAWWSLRGDSLFPSSEQGVAGVDTLLVAGLKRVSREIPQNNAYRYKPRYFYNILMNQVADGSAPNSLNPKQIAIDKAYTGCGFHFTPQVESYSAANKPRNVFAPGDKVHLNISKAPQNTPFTVYVIRHDDYTYVDDANVSTLLPHLANGFSHPITGNHTDAQGMWNGLVWTIPTGLANVDGGYDIIVDFGSPDAPDNKIHFTYTAANVMDGFDGLHEPGFTVKTPLSIDIVLALDCSPSMTDRSQISRTARQFVAQLEDGDRIGVFGFAAEEGANQYIQDVIKSRIPSGSLGLTTILNNKDYLCGQGVITFPNTPNHPYDSYCTNMRTPFTHGYTSFDELDRPKHFVTLSDGWHCLPAGTTGQGGGIDNPTYDIHNRILFSYEPSGIKCHTMRYKAYPSNSDGDYPYNEAQSKILMNSIAEWGNGTSWSRKSINETYEDINAILDAIRHSSSSIDENRSYIGPNPAQDTEIIQFLVDKNAHSLITNFSINMFSPDTSGLIDFNLVSPSGIDVTLNPDNYHYYSSLWRVELPFPEQGLWNAIITLPQSGTGVSRFSFSAKVQSDLDVHFIDPPRKHKMNVPLPLSVQAFDYLEPVTDAQVKVFLRRDDWFMELSLLDDGCHNDAQANDGIYSNYMYAYSNILQQYQHNAAGMYELIYELYSPSHTAKRVKKYRIELESPEDFPYVSTGRNLHSGWNWVGFPRLQRDVLGTSIDYATISLSPFLTDIMSSEGIAEYYNHKWSFYGFSSLKSEMGYKLRINNTDPVRLYELGTLIDTLMVHQLNEGQWNWVTYPCYETVYPWEALSGVLDRIDYIMAEKWSMKKEGDVWIYDGLSRPHLKYGDSVMIRTTMACSFIWNNPLTTPEVNEPQKPHHYVFEDKPDYETIMIESIEGNPDYTEIGIFQDDVCIGARVIEAYPIQILAYSTPAEEGGGPLSFMLYSESKGAVSVSPVTIHTGNYTANEPTIEPEQYGFRMLTLKTKDEQIPSVLALQSNYPNPFNPSTTINFSLPKTAHARLVIYNIRGQKVKVLVSDTLGYGNHSVVWNGRDSGNRPVASGVYFARLEQSGIAKIRKMMLMK